jgi:hypothetical protein
MYQKQRLQQHRHIRMVLRRMVHQIHQLPLNQIEMVELEYPRRLEYQHLYHLSQTPELVVLLVIVYQLQQHLRKQESVLVGLRLTDQVALVPQTAVRADVDQKLDDETETGVGVGLGVELLQQVHHHTVSENMQRQTLLLLVLIIGLGLGCRHRLPWCAPAHTLALVETLHLLDVLAYRALLLNIGRILT